MKKAATPLLQEPQLARLVPGTSYLSSKYTLKTNQEIERPLHQSGGWLLEHSNQSREFTLHMAKAQFLWLKQCEVKKKTLPGSGLLYRLKVCRMQSDDVFPVSRHNFQQLEEGDRGEIELLPAESESLHRLGFWQRCGVRLLCLVLVCYFLPMLSFIPLAIFGGVHMPSPWAGDYNHDAPTASVPSKDTAGYPGMNQTFTCWEAQMFG